MNHTQGDIAIGLLALILITLVLLARGIRKTVVEVETRETAGDSLVS